MKKIYAKGYLKLSVLGLCVGMFIMLYGIYSIINYTKGAELLCIFSSGLIILILYKVLKIFPNTWIKYDTDIITIRRISKEHENGKMQKKKNTLNVKNISKYGFSFELLQKNIEYTHGKNGALGIDLEIAILMKNNEKFPVDLMYYTKKQRKLLLQHIYTNTGIFPTGSLNNYL